MPFARILRYEMEHAGLSVESYCMTERFKREEEIDQFDNRPVLAFEQLDAIYGKKNFRIFLAIGYDDMNRGRERLFQKCMERDYEIGSYISPDVDIETVQMGKGNIILKYSRLGRFSTIGNGNIIWGSSTGHDGTIGDFNFLSGCLLGGMTSLANNCFVGMRSVVKEDISIGSYCLVGEGAILNKSIPDNTLVMPPRQRFIRANTENLAVLL